MAKKGPVGDERDLLHPLATLHWEESHTWKQEVEPVQCAILHNTVVILDYYNNLHVSSSLQYWITTIAPYYDSSLTTYQSKFVLVGGYDNSTGVTNTLLTSINGRDWDGSLPAMPTKRYDTSSVSGGSPEVLVVANGRGSDTSYLDVVEVLLSNHWTTAASLPTPCLDLQPIFHEGNFYLAEGREKKNYFLYVCSWDTLIASTRKEESSQEVWKEIATPDHTKAIASYLSRLIRINQNSVLTGYSNTTQTWLEWTNEGNVPERGTYHILAEVLSTGQLLIVNKTGVYKATLSVSTFDPNTRFVPNVLSRLEAVMGVQIVSVLANYHSQLTASQGDKLLRRVDKWDCKIALPHPEEDAVRYVEKVILHSFMEYSHPPTWRQLLDFIQAIGLSELSQQIEAFMKGDHKFKNAYKHFIDSKDVLELLCLKFMFLGPPRLGKSTTRRRFMKEIVDLNSAKEADQVHGSTGTVECCPNMLVQYKSDPATAECEVDWTIVQNLDDEACLLFHSLKDSLEAELFSASLIGSETKGEVSFTSSTVQSHPVEKPPQPNIFQKMKSKIKGVTNTRQSRPEDLSAPLSAHVRPAHSSEDYSEIAAIYNRVSRQPKFAQDIKHSVRAFLRMEDTGGQPELMDMLPALTIGPALYLLFFSYEFKLDEEYQVFYQRDSGETTTPEKSEFTLQEMLLCILASISCSNASTHTQPLAKDKNSEIDEILESSRSVVYIVGTHKDKVKADYIATVDQQLQKIIQETQFYKKGIIQYCSEDKLVISLDNMGGGIEEIQQLHQLLEHAMEKHYKKLRIPARWLLFSLCLRMRDVRTASMETCLALSSAFNMTPYETKVALWFLHHHAGVMMYFPNVADLENLVIIDIQVVYDSITCVILKAMSFNIVGQATAERFRKTGRFTMKDLRSTTADTTGDLITPYQLVALLEYLHIIAQILSDESSDYVLVEGEFIMPCVLENSSSKELDVFHKESCKSCVVAPLFIHFMCGFTPMGLFPAAMACFISNKSFFFVKEGIKKNMVHFLYGSKEIRVTFISRSTYYEFVISYDPSFQGSIHYECTALKREIESTLKEASSRMNYSSYMDYKFAFECHCHEGEHHLGIVYEVGDIPSVMRCVKDPQGVALQNRHLIWYGQEYKKQSETEVSERENYLSLFIKMIPDLVITVKSCVMTVADHCFSVGLITEDTYDQLVQREDLINTDKARILLNNIRALLSSTPTALKKLISILLQEECCYEVAKRIQQQLQV